MLYAYVQAASIKENINLCKIYYFIKHTGGIVDWILKRNCNPIAVVVIEMKEKLTKLMVVINLKKKKKVLKSSLYSLFCINKCIT